MTRDEFLTSMTSTTKSYEDAYAVSPQSKADSLLSKKQEKLDRLGAQSQYEDLSSTYTVMPAGNVESNANKIWNEMSSGNVQDMLGDAANKSLRKDPTTGKYYYNTTGEEYTGDTRRAYMYGTKANDGSVKFGLARGDLQSSDARYQPGAVAGYGWDAGPTGVDTNKNYMDMLLPYDVATALEGAVHGRKDALANRKYPDYLSDEALKQGSGVSEYYKSPEGLFGDTSKMSKSEISKADTSLLDRYRTLPGAQNKYAEARGFKPVDTDTRLGETIDTAQSAFLKFGAGVLNMADKVAESTGLNTLMDSANKAIGVDKPVGWTKDAEGDNTVPLTGVKVKTILDPVVGQRIADKWAGVDPKTREEYNSNMKQSAKDWKEGNYVSSMYSAATQLDRLLADSAPEIATMMIPGGGGVALVAATRASNQSDEYAKNNDGNTFTPAQYAESFLTNIALLVPEKILIKSGVADVLGVGSKQAAGIYDRAKGILKTAAGEATQEYGEHIQETYATQKEGDKTLKEIATSPEAGFSAAVGGLMGGTLAGVGAVKGVVEDTSLKYSQDKYGDEVAAKAKATAEATTQREQEKEALRTELGNLSLQMDEAPDESKAAIQAAMDKITEELSILESAPLYTYTSYDMDKDTQAIRDLQDKLETTKDTDEKSAIATKINVLQENVNGYIRRNGAEVEATEPATPKSVYTSDNLNEDTEVVNTLVAELNNPEVVMTPEERAAKDTEIRNRQINMDEYGRVKESAANAIELNKLLETEAKGNGTQTKEDVELAQMQAEKQIEDSAKDLISRKNSIAEEIAKLPELLAKQAELQGIKDLGGDVQGDLMDIASKVSMIKAMEEEAVKINAVITGLIDRKMKALAAAQVQRDLEVKLAQEDMSDTDKVNLGKNVEKAEVETNRVLGAARFSMEVIESAAKRNIAMLAINSPLKEKTGGKAVTLDVSEVSDADIASIPSGNMTKSRIAELIGNKTISKLAQGLMKHLELKSPVRRTLSAIYDTLGGDRANAAKAKLEKVTNGDVSTERLMRAVMLAVSNVYKTKISEVFVQQNLGVQDVSGIDYARKSGIVAQIGKEYINSYGAKLAHGSEEAINEMYAEVGNVILEAAETLGIITTKIANVPLIKAVDEDGDVVVEHETINIARDKKGILVSSDTIVKVNEDYIVKSKKNAEIGHALDVMSRIVRPTNYELPREKYEEYVKADRKISDEHINIIRKLNKMKFSVKPEMLELLRELKEYKESNNLSMDALLADKRVQELIGVKTHNSMLTKSSEQGQKLNRADTLRNILDNLDHIDGVMYYNYESAINTRIHLMQTILEFQGDKYLSRNIMTGGVKRKVTTDNGKALIVESVAKELKVTEDEVKNPSGELKKWVDVYKQNGKIPLLEIPKMRKDLKQSSPYKAYSLLIAVADINAANGGDINTDYMVEGDMSASGVINTLLNLSGDKAVQAVVDKLKDDNLDPYMHLDTVLREKAKGSPTLTGVLESMKELEDIAGIDSRDMAKYVVMTWFYGSSKSNVELRMSNDIAVDLVRDAMMNSNQPGVDKVNGIIGENKYVVDVLDDTDTRTRINDISQEDFNKVKEYIRSTIAEEYVNGLSTAFPGVSKYQGDIAEIFKMLEATGQWDGTIETAMSKMFDGKYKMSTKKMKTMLHVLKDENGDIKVGNEYIPVNKMFLNVSSLKVNPQHAIDAMQLLMTMSHIMDVYGPDVSAMTVHDAIYGPADIMTEAKAKFEKLLVEGASKYDFREVALDALVEARAEMKGTEDGVARIDEVISDMSKQVAESKAAKAKYLDGLQTNLFGSKTIGVGQEPQIVSATTIEEREAKVIAEQTAKNEKVRTIRKKYNIPKMVMNLVTDGAGVDLQSMTTMVESLEVSEKYADMKSRVLEFLQGKDSKVMLAEGKDRAVFYGGKNNTVYIDVDGRILGVYKADGDTDADTYVKILAHEVDHAYNYAYINDRISKDKPTPEIKYLSRVLKHLGEKSAKGHVLSTHTASRLKHILTSETEAEKITELISVMRNEPAVAEDIRTLLPDSVLGKITSSIQDIIKAVVGMVSNLSMGDREKMFADASKVTMVNMYKAMEILNQEGKVYEAAVKQDINLKPAKFAKATSEVKSATIQELEKEFTKEELNMIKACK